MSLIAGRGCRWPPRRDSVSPCAPLSGGGRDTHDGHENSPILVFFSNLLEHASMNVNDIEFELAKLAQTRDSLGRVALTPIIRIGEEGGRILCVVRQQGVGLWCVRRKAPPVFLDTD